MGKGLGPDNATHEVTVMSTTRQTRSRRRLLWSLPVLVSAVLPATSAGAQEAPATTIPTLDVDPITGLVIRPPTIDGVPVVFEAPPESGRLPATSHDRTASSPPGTGPFGPITEDLRLPPAGQARTDADPIPASDAARALAATGCPAQRQCAWVASQAQGDGVALHAATRYDWNTLSENSCTASDSGGTWKNCASSLANNNPSYDWHVYPDLDGAGASRVVEADRYLPTLSSYMNNNIESSVGL